MTLHRPFPIVHDNDIKSVPWAILAPHEKRALTNHRQTLEQLANRGGLTPEEAVAIIEDRPWERMPRHLANDQLLEYAKLADSPEWRGRNVPALAPSARPSRDEDIDNALKMVRNLRDGLVTPGRFHFNKLEAILERLR